jgi:hypothetical protein
MAFLLLYYSLLFKLCYRATTQINSRLPPLRLIDQTKLDKTLGTFMGELSVLRWSHDVHNTQQSLEKYIHVLSRIRTLNPISRAAALERTDTGISFNTLQIGNNNKCFWYFTKLKFKTRTLIKWIYQLYLYSKFNGVLIHTYAWDRPFQFNPALIVLHILSLPWLNPLIELDGSVQ